IPDFTLQKLKRQTHLLVIGLSPQRTVVQAPCQLRLQRRYKIDTFVVGLCYRLIELIKSLFEEIVFELGNHVRFKRPARRHQLTREGNTHWLSDPGVELVETDYHTA